MSTGTYIHTHRGASKGEPRTDVHNPDGTLIGHTQRGYVRTDLTHLDGRVTSSWAPGWLATDENDEPIGPWCETRERAIEWIAER